MASKNKTQVSSKELIKTPANATKDTTVDLVDITVSNDVIDNPLKAEIEAQKTRIAELEELLKTKGQDSVKKSKPSKVTVNHAVFIPEFGRKFTKEQIESNTEIQEYLLDIKSTAVTLNK